MTTLREAATQALEAMEGGSDSWQLVGPAIDALKEALVEDAMQKFTDVNQELQAALGCDHCNHPLYAATRCRVCGRVTSAEPVQESAICDECGKHKRDGWALYCVGCVEPMFAPPQRPAEPVQEPFCYVYEYDSPYGLHREFYPREYNGMKPSRTVPLYAAPPQRKPEPMQEPVAWMYTGIKQDGTEHGPHLVWKPAYMDAMSASKGAHATPLYTAPPQRPAESVQDPVAQQALNALVMMRDKYGEYACPACDHADAAILALRTQS